MGKQKKTISSKDIQQLSAAIMKSTGSKISSTAGDFDSSKGDFRRATVRNENWIHKDQAKVPEKVAELIEELSASLPKSKDYIKNSTLAFDVHFQMVSIHPFADGNGRLSRLLMNYVQMFHEHPMTVVFPEDRMEYFNALEETRKKEDISVFRNFMFSQSYKYFKNEIKMLGKAQKKSQSKGKGISFIF